jgi:hypothetical protein
LVGSSRSASWCKLPHSYLRYLRPSRTLWISSGLVQQVFIEIAKFAKRVSREMVIDLDL